MGKITPRWAGLVQYGIGEFNKIMNKFILPAFIALGALDFLYGVVSSDRMSVIAGGAIVAIAIYIWKKRGRGG